MHMHMLMYTQPHTHTQHTNMYIHMQLPHTHTHTYIHTHHHVHTGWIISSYCCEPGGAWRDCREAPSGWGYSRPEEQGGKLLLSAHLVFHMQYSLYTKYHKTLRAIWRDREHIQHIDTDDMHGRTKLFMHWKHVYLAVWGCVFLRKFELRMLVLDQNSGEVFSYKLGL